MADEVRLGVAVVPVRVSLDELDKGLSRARSNIEKALGPAWQKAAATTDSVTEATNKMGDAVQTAMVSKGVPSVRKLQDGLLSVAKGVGVFTGALVAAGFTINKALEFGEAGAELVNLRQSFDHVAASAGASGDALLREMQATTGGIMSQAELMQQYNAATMLLGPEIAARFGDMVAMAAKTSAAGMGTFQQQLDSLVRGVGRLTPQILDNLGVVADWPVVYAAAAQELGKTAEQLTDFEKKTAMLNEAQRQIEAKLGGLGTGTQRAGMGIGQLRAATTDYINYLKMEAMPAIDATAQAIADMLNSRPGGSRYVDAILEDIYAIGAAQRKVQAPQTGIGLLDDWLGQFREGDLVMRRMGVSANEQEAALAALAKQIDVTVMSQEEFVRVQRAFALQSQSVADGLTDQRIAFLHARNEQEHMINTARRLVGGFDDIGSHASGAAKGVNELTAAMQALSKASDISAAISAVDQARKEADARARWRREVEQTRAFDPQMAEQLELAGWYSFIIDDQEAYNQMIITGTSLTEDHWETQRKGAAAASSSYSDLQSAMESYYDSWQSQAASIMSPTQDFDLNSLIEEVYGYQDKWDEAARRAMDVVKLGAESPWAEQMGLGGKEDALQYVKDFYAGRLPEDVNWDAAIGQYQQQMEQMLGQQNLAAMFQEKLVTAGWGPENETVMAALEAPFTPGGTNSAQAFATAFSDYDWEGTATATSDRIMSALSAELSKGAGKYAPWFESFVIRTVERVFFGGEKP